MISEHQQPKEYIITEYQLKDLELVVPLTSDCPQPKKICKAIRSRPHPAQPTEAQQRIDAEQEVIKAAMNWWMMQRPLKWSVEQHLKTPTVNCVGNQERALAEALVFLQAGDQHE